jgi:hypothetical protein
MSITTSTLRDGTLWHVWYTYMIVHRNKKRRKMVELHWLIIRFLVSLRTDGPSDLESRESGNSGAYSHV